MTGQAQGRDRAGVRRVALARRSLRRRVGSTRGSSGYTLTELVVVLGILAVALGMGGVWFASQVPHYRLNGAVQQIRADLLAARARAVKQGNKVRVMFLDAHHYDILDGGNNDGDVDPGEVVEHRSLLEDFEGVTMQFSKKKKEVTFYPRGNVSSLTIMVDGAAGAKKISINRMGRVRIISPD